MLQAVNLKHKLVFDPVNRPQPLNHCERNGMILPFSSNPLHDALMDLKDFTDKKLMRIKEKKTNVMKFNFSHKYDFPPEILIEGFKNHLDVVQQTKLLGVILSDDLKWAANTDYICRKAYERIWILRRMKVLSVSPHIILDVYTKEVRSVVELAVPAWHSGITVKQSDQIERIQKVAVSIIFGRNKMSYLTSLKLLGLDTLKKRRESLCLNFVKKSLKSRHRDMFVDNCSNYDTRNKKSFVEPKSNSKRVFMSPLVYLTRLGNSCKVV